MLPALWWQEAQQAMCGARKDARLAQFLERWFELVLELQPRKGCAGAHACRDAF